MTNMKFILSEQISKHILSEKYILKEADGENKKLSDGLSASFKEFLTQANETQATLKKFFGDKSLGTIASNFLKATKEPKQLVTSKTTQKYSIIRTKFLDYLNALDTVLDKLDHDRVKYGTIREVSTKLKTSLQSETVTAKEQAKIVKQAKGLFDIFGEFETDCKKAVEESAKYEATYNKITELIKLDIDLLLKTVNDGKQDDLEIPVKDLREALGTCILHLKEFDKAAGDTEKLEGLDEDFANISRQIKQINDIAKLNGIEAESQSTTATGEWGQRLKNAAQSASTFAPVFKLFAKEVLGAKDDKTAEGYLGLNVNNAIMSECSQLGYSTQRNPFLAFLATPLCQKLVSSGTITAKKYGIIHNAFIGGQSNHSFDANTLSGTGIFGKADLIFCENF